MSDDDIKELEDRLDLRFPPDYRGFLKSYQGGYPEPDGFEFGEDGSSVDKFLAVYGNKLETIEGCIDIYRGRYPDGLLPVANDPGGNLILLGVSERFDGIYFWNHETEADEGEEVRLDNL